MPSQDIGNYSLPPCSRSRDAGHGGNEGGHAAAEATAAQAAGEAQDGACAAAGATPRTSVTLLPGPPWDWVLTKSIRLSCTSPFTCLEPAAALRHAGSTACVGDAEQLPSLQVECPRRLLVPLLLLRRYAFSY